MIYQAVHWTSPLITPPSLVSDVFNMHFHSQILTYLFHVAYVKQPRHCDPVQLIKMIAHLIVFLSFFFDLIPGSAKGVFPEENGAHDKTCCRSHNTLCMRRLNCIPIVYKTPFYVRNTADAKTWSGFLLRFSFRAVLVQTNRLLVVPGIKMNEKLK